MKMRKDHVMYSEVCSLEFALIIFCVFSSFLRNMATGFGREYSIRSKGGRGNNTGTIPRYSRHDNNFFAVLGEDTDSIQDGGNKFDLFACASDTDDDFIPVRGKHLSGQELAVVVKVVLLVNPSLSQMLKKIMIMN